MKVVPDELGTRTAVVMVFTYVSIEHSSTNNLRTYRYL